MKQKKSIFLSFLITGGFILGACSDKEDEFCDTITTVEIAAGSTEDSIQEKFAAISECSVVKFAAGSYELTRRIITNKSMVAIQGAGSDADGTILNFSGEAENNGILMSGGDFVGVNNLTIMNAKGNSALRIEEASGVVIANVKVDWNNTLNGTVTGTRDNGAYGIYPVESENILIDNVTVYGASDAGIYVGKSKNVVVQNSTASWNVAGIEIENTENALVINNTAENNTGGLVVFDLPGNTMLGKNVRLVNNMIKNNNTANFCNSGTVCQIPNGVGTFILASREVELSGNTYVNNDGIDLAILSGLALEPNIIAWTTPAGFNTHNIYVKNNIFGGTGSGDALAPTARQQLGGALQVLRIAENTTDTEIGETDSAKNIQVRAILTSATTPLSIPTVVVDGINNVDFCIRDNTSLTGLFDLNLPMTSRDDQIAKLSIALMAAAAAGTQAVMAFRAAIAAPAPGLPTLMMDEALTLTYTLKGLVKNLDANEVAADTSVYNCEGKTLSLPSLSSDVNKIVSDLLETSIEISK